MPYIGKNTQVTYTPDTKTIEKVTYKDRDITKSLVAASNRYWDQPANKKDKSSSDNKNDKVRQATGWE